MSVIGGQRAVKECAFENVYVGLLLLGIRGDMDAFSWGGPVAVGQMVDEGLLATRQTHTPWMQRLTSR